MIDPETQKYTLVLSPNRYPGIVETADMQKKFQAHVAQIIKLAEPQADAEKMAEKVKLMYEGLSKLSDDRIENKEDNLEKNPELGNGWVWNHMFTWEDLGDRIGMDWEKFWKNAGFPDYKEKIPKVGVESEYLITQLHAVIGVAPENVQLVYERVFYLYDKGEYIEPLADIQNKFNMAVGRLRPSKEFSENWRGCTDFMIRNMGWAVSRLFVTHKLKEDPHFRKRTKAFVEKILKEIKPELVPWMDKHLKEITKAKIKSMAVLVGYPDWMAEFNETFSKQMSEVYGQESDGDNMFVIDRWLKSSWRKFTLKNIGHTDNREWEVWDVTPVDNSHKFYDIFSNTAYFPIAHLRPPLMRSGEEYAIFNWGSFGTVVGKSIFHAFDEKGAKYNEWGKMLNCEGHLPDNGCWSTAVKSNYQNIKSCISNQYKKMGVHDTSTIREDIADTAGLQFAYKKFETEIDPHWEGIYDGRRYTAQQLFYITYAQTHCTKFRQGGENAYLKKSPYSLPQFRVNGAASNSLGFAKAFQCQEGSAMTPSKRCQVVLE